MYTRIYTMNIKIKYIGIVSRKIGKSNDKLEIQEPITVKDLFNYLIRIYKLEKNNPFYITNKNRVEPSVFVMKNQKLALLDEKISDNDTIVILPIIAGG